MLRFVGCITRANERTNEDCHRTSGHLESCATKHWANVRLRALKSARELPLAVARQLTVAIHANLKAFSEPACSAMVPMGPIDRALAVDWRKTGEAVSFRPSESSFGSQSASRLYLRAPCALHVYLRFR